MLLCVLDAVRRIHTDEYRYMNLYVSSMDRSPALGES